MKELPVAVEADGPDLLAMMTGASVAAPNRRRASGKPGPVYADVAAVCFLT